MVRAIFLLVATWALVALCFVVPWLDSTRAPFVDLNSLLSQVAYWVAWSASSEGLPYLVLVMLVIFVTRESIQNGQRWKELGLLTSIVLLFAGGGAALNEHFVKAELEVPRPNIAWLAGDNGLGPLGMTPDQFYATGDKAARSRVLSQVLGRSSVSLSPAVASHWVHETGYSFPSGHAFAALFVASFFVVVSVSVIKGRRRWCFYALLPWALAVCYSRPILRVHTPLDVTVGGLQGLLLGVLAGLLVRALFQANSQRHAP